MKRGGDGWFIDHGKAFRLLERAPEVEITDPRRVLGSIESAATITVAEMRANVGDVDESVRNPRETVRRAQAKIKLYPFIFDRLAPGARCDWAIPVSAEIQHRVHHTLAGSYVTSSPVSAQA